MLNIYRLTNGKLETFLDHQEVGENELVWIDLIAPTPSECAYVSQQFKQPIVSISEMSNIESTARFYEDKSGLHILSFFLSEVRSAKVSNSTVSFTLHRNCLFSLRERELAAFRLYRIRCKKFPSITFSHPYQPLLGLLEIKTEQLADEIESIYNELETLRPMTHERDEEKFLKTLLQLAHLENCSSKIRLCLVDSQRAFKFLLQKRSSQTLPDADCFQQAREMQRDIESLIPHNEMLFQRISFLTQTTIGLIQMEQNRIMKFISIVSAVTIPTLLVTGWFGMDFNCFFGPEYTSWRYQLPAAIVMFAASYGLYELLRQFKLL